MSTRRMNGKAECQIPIAKPINTKEEKEKRLFDSLVTLMKWCLRHNLPFTITNKPQGQMGGGT